MEILNYVSVLTIPLLVTVIVMDGILKKKTSIFDLFKRSGKRSENNCAVTSCVDWTVDSSRSPAWVRAAG